MSQEESNPNPEEAPGTAPEVKSCLQELLKHGVLNETAKGPLFRHAIVHEVALNRSLEPLDLVLRIDTHRGLAFLAVAPSVKEDTDAGEEWSHPLVRRHRFTLEQSLLIALLRQAFLHHEQEAGVGNGEAKIAVEDLLPQFLTFLGDSGSDSRNESRLTSLLDQLKSHGIVSEIDRNQEVVIRPLIAHLANPESLSQLLALVESKAKEPS